MIAWDPFRTCSRDFVKMRPAGAPGVSPYCGKQGSKWLETSAVLSVQLGHRSCP